MRMMNGPRGNDTNYVLPLANVYCTVFRHQAMRSEVRLRFLALYQYLQQTTRYVQWLAAFI